ncbi:MAG: hypothetical protein JWR80_8554 [Bradyrhizobium sp.]|nr:hypothetical protein [Bradyrhizobium sp.]
MWSILRCTGVPVNSWRDMAADIMAAKRPSPDAPAPAEPERFALPDDLREGVSRLAVMRPPRITRPEIWGEVVADALRLVQEGWASHALSLGWSGGDLFGIGPKDDWEFEGLAVWLRSRKLVMIDAATAVVMDGAKHAYFERGGPGHGRMPTIAPVMLWNFGRKG